MKAMIVAALALLVSIQQAQAAYVCSVYPKDPKARILNLNRPLVEKEIFKGAATTEVLFEDESRATVLFQDTHNQQVQLVRLDKVSGVSDVETLATNKDAKFALPNAAQDLTIDCHHKVERAKMAILELAPQYIKKDNEGGSDPQPSQPPKGGWGCVIISCAY